MKRKTRAELTLLLRKELTACVKCGNCMAPCPLFQQTRQEAFNMRGKIAILQAIEAGQSIPPEKVAAALSQCLGCQSCKVACPNSVDTPLVMLLGKILLAPEDDRLPELLSFQARILSRRYQLKMALLPLLMHGIEALLTMETVKTMVSRIVSVFQPIQQICKQKFYKTTKHTKEKQLVLQRHFVFLTKDTKLTEPLSKKTIVDLFSVFSVRSVRSAVVVLENNLSKFSAFLRALCALCGKFYFFKHSSPVFQQQRTVNNPQKSASHDDSIVVFPGCSLQQNARSMNHLTEILQATGKPIKILSTSECCGMPALQASDLGLHEAMVESLFRSLEEQPSRQVVFACAKCLYNFKMIDKFYSLTPAESHLVENSTDLYSFLESCSLPQKNQISLSAVFHDPCIQLRGAKVKDQPRRILQALLKNPLVETPKEGSCCGYGNGFYLRQPVLGKAVQQERIGSIVSKNPQLVVSTDFQCLDALTLPLRKKGIQARHLIDLLAEALQEKTKA